MNEVFKMIKITKKFKKIRNSNKRDNEFSKLIKQCNENESLILKFKNLYQLKFNYIKMMFMNKKQKTKQNKRMNKIIKQFETIILTIRVITSTAISVFQNVLSELID